jgi:hypothetical protein
MQLSLDEIQKVAQIAFYVTLAVVTVLTFLRAKKGLLSNVNTEYHKKVIERLDALSKALLDEYDLDSPNHWSKHLLAGDAVRKINKQFLASRPYYERGSLNREYQPTRTTSDSLVCCSGSSLIHLFRKKSGKRP